MHPEFIPAKLMEPTFLLCTACDARRAMDASFLELNAQYRQFNKLLWKQPHAGAIEVLQDGLMEFSERFTELVGMIRNAGAVMFAQYRLATTSDVQQNDILRSRLYPVVLSLQDYDAQIRANTDTFSKSFEQLKALWATFCQQNVPVSEISFQALEVAFLDVHLQILAYRRQLAPFTRQRVDAVSGKS